MNNGFPTQLIQILKDTTTRKRQKGHNKTQTKKNMGKLYISQPINQKGT
jgi:hypothetical protein